MRRMKISSLENTDKWCKSDMVPINSDSQATLHMNAAVRLPETSPQTTRQIKLDESKIQQDAVRVWYDKLTQEELNWGTNFATMEEVFRDRPRTAQVAAATTHLQQREKFSQYMAHPISIDVMLQTAFVATTGGWVSKLRANIETLMKRKGIHPINEDELIQIVNMALMNQRPCT